MRYDEFGNPIYDAPEPSLDDMRFALSQQNKLTPQQMERVVAPPSAVSQIPTGGSPKAPQAQRPLDQVTNDLRAMATGMNPLMMMKSMRDVANTLVVNPLLMPASIAIEAAQGKPARDITGQALYQAPQTPAGQQFAEGLAKTFEAAKVPHMWPLTPRPAGTRTMLTPNDVRVMGAEATRMGRQIRDIPTDYANAAAGLTKLDPVTETPTLGARLGQAERGVVETGKRAERALDPIVTDIMERGGTSADLLAAMAGQPSYAVRPKGTTLVTPTRPEPATNSSITYPYDPVQDVLLEVLGEPQKTTLNPSQITDAYEYSSLAQQMRGIEPALSEYMGQRIAAMYPDAPSQAAAEVAFHARYADTSAKAAKQQELLTDFLTQTPEGLASGVPTPAELQNRHAAAVTWLNGPFANYIKRNVGAEGDPLVKLASQGLTFLPNADIHQMAPDIATRTDVRNDRVAAGFPEMGSFAEAISNKTRELDQLRAEITELESRRAVLSDVARSQGLRDPADLPEYAALTNPIRAKARERDKLQKDIDNLSLGRAYEDLSDFAIAPTDAGSLQQNWSYEMQQFYPTVMQTPGTEMVYRASARRMLNIGLGDIASAFYNDVMSGAIPLDKVQKTTVENYVRGKAQDRIKTEAEAKAKEAAYVANVEEKLKAVLADVPNDMKFGNAAVIELTNATPMDTVIARMSEDTAVLDHCVGEGGHAGDKTINPFTGKKQSYTPIIDVLTGQKHSNASGSATGYTRSVGRGNQLASIRSLDTGRPVATLQFAQSHLGQDGQQKYRIGYASGVHNGNIDPAYATAIRDYLNSRADSISGTGENLADNAGVFDTNDQDDIRKLGRKLNLSSDELRYFDWGQLPRFIVADDVRALLQEGQAATQQPTTQQPAVQQPFTVEDLRAYLNTAQRTIGVDESRLLRNTLVNARNSFDGAPSWAELLREQPTALAERIAEFAQEQDNAIVEQELLNLADRIAPPVPPARPLNPPDAWPLVGQQLTEQQPAAPAMPDILGAPDEAAQAANALMAEPEPQQPAQRGLELFEEYGIARDLLEDARIDNQTFDVDDLRTTLQALDTAQFDDARVRALPPAQQEQAQREVATALRRLISDAGIELEPAEPQQQPNVAPFRPIAARVAHMTHDELRNALTPAEIGEVAAVHDGIVLNNPDPNDIRTIAQLVLNHQMGPWENFPDTVRAMLRMKLTYTANRIETEPPRRGPFRAAGSAAVRGVPLGNLNLQPAITAEMLRGPDTQPVRNFVQQVRGLPGVTQEGLRTGLMAFEQMDPARQITKTEFVRELLPSSYDIVDLRGASQDNQHLMDAAQNAFDQDASPIGDVLGLKGAQLTAWANAVRTQYNDYDSFPANVKRALAKQGIEDADEYTEAYDTAYRDALETYVAEYAGNLADEDGYTYANTQRLVQPSMGDEYGEFGVTHPDQRGTYHHFDLAPQGVIGHFRGTYNPADPLTLTYWDQQGNQQYFETPNNSYAIEEIQSDAQKIAEQTGHLHQVHGVLFKSAIQKALELGADTVYLPTASIIARTRGSQPKKFAPIYDQAIVKEGLKPLLKIPGVTSKMVNGYHEISFTPEAIEHILTGPGQNVPGYKEGGKVEKAAPGLLSASHRAIERAQEMFPHDKDQDSRADAARHLLASGYLAKSWNPTVAKAAGWWHEFSEAPTRTLRHNLGLGSPRYDYPMDMHNNQLGIELAKKAKTIPEFEKLVQEEILRATEQQTPGRVHVMPAKEAQKAAADSVRQYANGGKVHTTTDLDKMRLELMMRSK